jgi:23S rRNA pseudouridine1911/1915/1917 synthase
LLHVVTAEQAGKRTDVIVASLAGASRSQAARRARNGEVLVNGVPAKPSAVLEEGDVLDFNVPPPRPLVARPESIELAVIYEDEDILVVDKPAGMVTHPAVGAPHGTLVNAVLAHVEGPLPGDALRGGLVHRLDRDTSGLIVVAKSDESLRELRAAMKTRRIEREYLGLVCGVPQHRQGAIEGPIGRDPRFRLRFAIVTEGKPAITHYAVREPFAGHAELVFRLETGRTHQIRVHLAAAGYPILNDPLYGKKEARLELPGQALHAWRLAFRHPRTGEPLQFEAQPTAAYLQARKIVSS